VQLLSKQIDGRLQFVVGDVAVASRYDLLVFCTESRMASKDGHRRSVVISQSSIVLVPVKSTRGNFLDFPVSSDDDMKQEPSIDCIRATVLREYVVTAFGLSLTTRRGLEFLPDDMVCGLDASILESD
jgi:hypothetical protein